MPRKPTVESVFARFVTEAEKLSDRDLLAVASMILDHSGRFMAAFGQAENAALKERLRRRKPDAVKDPLMARRNAGILRVLREGGTLQQAADDNPTPVKTPNGIVWEITSIEAAKKVQHNRREEVRRKWAQQEASQEQ